MQSRDAITVVLVTYVRAMNCKSGAIRRVGTCLSTYRSSASSAPALESAPDDFVGHALVLAPFSYRLHYWDSPEMSVMLLEKRCQYCLAKQLCAASRGGGTDWVKTKRLAACRYGQP